MIGQYIYTIKLLTTLNEAFRRRLSSIHIPSLSNYKPLSERNAPMFLGSWWKAYLISNHPVISSLCIEALPETAFLCTIKVGG